MFCKTIPIVVLLLFTIGVRGQQADSLRSSKTDSIARKLSLVNEIHTKNTEKSIQYNNYCTLKKTATTNELVNLINNKSPIVACYAFWALIEKKYSNIPSLFVQIQKRDTTIQVFELYAKKEKLSENIYYKYWESIANGKRNSDNTLFLLDSLVLSNSKSSYILIARALKNRLYPPSFNPVIESWAFEKNNNDAVFYLANWHRADYKLKIQQTLISYLNSNDFKMNGGAKMYYKAIEELLRFSNEEAQKAVVEKLKKDKSWIKDKEIFNPLLEQYGIYMSDFEE